MQAWSLLNGFDNKEESVDKEPVTRPKFTNGSWQYMTDFCSMEREEEWCRSFDVMQGVFPAEDYTRSVRSAAELHETIEISSLTKRS